jgi:hypothetical protein
VRKCNKKGGKYTINVSVRRNETSFQFLSAYPLDCPPVHKARRL